MWLCACSVEYNISYLYHSLHSFFARDNVALPGFAKYFDDASTEEREHARKLMYVQSVRGGRVKLLSIGMPEMEVCTRWQAALAELKVAELVNGLTAACQRWVTISHSLVSASLRPDTCPTAAELSDCSAQLNGDISSGQVPLHC